MVSTWALDRPKIFSVVSPLTTSRKCPESACNTRNWRSVCARVAIPTSAMKIGISGRVTTMITAEIQSTAKRAPTIMRGTMTARNS